MENFKPDVKKLILLEKLPTVKIPAPQYPGGWRYMTYGKFLCYCGTEFVTKLVYVNNGDCQSCGCLNKTKYWRVKHRGRDTALYNVWKGMRQRCFNPNDSSYYNYGERGITVEECWNDYIVFKKWSEDNGYKKGLTLDRINTYGNYGPNNCRWATRQEQNINVRKRSVKCSSKYKGVGFREYADGNRWKAAITVNKKRIPLGKFLTEEAAAEAYNAAALHYFKDFAALNIIIYPQSSENS